MESEIRLSQEKPEIREVGGKQVIRGYAAVFNSPSEPLGKKPAQWMEVVKPGAFARSLRSNPDVIARYNHGRSSESLPLGRTSSGTLRLGEDSHGLWYEIDPPDTQQARDLMQSMRRGDVCHSSFAFNVNGREGERWGKTGDTVTRELHDVDLMDVAPVTDPAYRSADCSVAMRSLEKWQSETATQEKPEQRAVPADFMAGMQVAWWKQHDDDPCARLQVGHVLHVFTEGDASIPGTDISVTVGDGGPIALVGCDDDGDGDIDMQCLVPVSELLPPDEDQPEAEDPAGNAVTASMAALAIGKHVYWWETNDEHKMALMRCGCIVNVTTEGDASIPGTSITLPASADDPVATIDIYSGDESEDAACLQPMSVLSVLPFDPTGGH